MNSTTSADCAASTPRTVTPWFYAAFMTLLVAIVGYQSIALLRPGRATRKFQMDYTFACRSIPLLLVQTLPLLVPAWRESLPDSFVIQYGWLPFWYVFTMDVTYGGLLRVGRDAILGVVIALSGSHLMNWLMPGGAGPLARHGSDHFDSDFTTWALLPGGYSPAAALIYASCFAYLVFQLPLTTDTKRFCMGAFASDIVTFMNPDQSTYAFYAVFYDYRFHWNLSGPSMSLFWVVLISISLSAMSLLPRPLVFGSSWNRSALAQASADAAGLALDSGGTLRLLLAYYCQGASEFELEGVSRYIENMKDIKKSVDVALDAVRWESFTANRKLRSSHLRWLSVLIERLHIILQFLLVQIRINQESRDSGSDALCIAPHLESFLSCVDILGELASPDYPRLVSTDPELANKCCQACVDADEALKAAMWTLAQKSAVSVDRDPADAAAGVSDHSLPFVETAFLDTLREWVALLRRFAQGPPSFEVEAGRSLSCFSRENVRSAFRNALSWVFALLYCVHMAKYSSMCVVTVSFIFSKNLSTLWDRNLNRFIGVTLSTMLGNLPVQACFSGCAYDPSRHSWVELFTYLSMMGCIWLMAVYTYLEGGRWSYAFSLVAGIGGVHMLKPLGIIAHRGNWRYEDYNNLADTSMALIITFAVDVVFSWMFRLGCLHLVADAVSDAIQAAGLILDDFMVGTDIHSVTSDLREHADLHTKMELRRVFHEKVATLREVHQEARMKESSWHVPYKTRLVDDFISQFDVISAATYSICTSVERCSSSRNLRSLLQKCIPLRLPHLIRGYARCAKQALHQKTHADAWDVDKELYGMEAEGPLSRATSTSSSSLALSLKSNESSYLGSNLSPSLVNPGSSSETGLGELCRRQSVRRCSLAQPQASDRDRAFDPRRFRTVWEDLAVPLQEAGLLTPDNSGCLRVDSCEAACEAAASFAVVCGVLGLRLCFEKIEVMLRDEEFMCFGHWGFASNSALERLRSHTVDKGHFVRPSTSRKNIVVRHESSSVDSEMSLLSPVYERSERQFS